MLEDLPLLPPRADQAYRRARGKWRQRPGSIGASGTIGETGTVLSAAARGGRGMERPDEGSWLQARQGSRPERDELSGGMRSRCRALPESGNGRWELETIRRRMITPSNRLKSNGQSTARLASQKPLLPEKWGREEELIIKDSPVVIYDEYQADPPSNTVSRLACARSKATYILPHVPLRSKAVIRCHLITTLGMISSAKGPAAPFLPGETRWRRGFARLI